MGDKTRCRISGGTPEDLLELVGDIYQAGLEPDHWPAVMASMSQVFDADLACIYTPITARPEQSIYLTYNFSSAMEKAYTDYYQRIDEWSGTALRQHRYIQGYVALGEAIIPQRELRRTEFYQDFLRHFDMEWIVSTVLFEASPETPATHMTFTRNLGRGAYDDEGIRLVELLAPHVRRALLTYWRLNSASLRGNVMESALDHMGFGLVLLDGKGRVLTANPMAETVFRRGDGLGLHNDRLHADQPQEHEVLTRLIQDACLGMGGDLYIQSGGGMAPYRLSAIPLTQAPTATAFDLQAVAARPKAMLMIHDPASTKQKDGLGLFAAHHRITPAELRVLELLLRDQAPSQIAEQLGVGIRTVRSQLSSLFNKTGARNQRELIAQALRHI